MGYTAKQIFVPGGMPNHTYILRQEYNLEEQLRAAKDNLCKLVIVTGATKSGKTVLVKKIFPREKNIWVDGGVIDNENDFWESILDQLDGYTDVSTQESSTSELGIESGGEVEVGVPIVGQVKVKAGGSGKKNFGKSQNLSRSLSPKTSAVSQLRNIKIPLIIDDFHYLSRNIQGNIIRALRSLIFDGQLVILIVIPHRRYDAIRVEREITGRIESIDVPAWDINELVQISDKGFPLLNLEMNDETSENLAKEAYGSPHLMQEFCRAIAGQNDKKAHLFQKFEIVTVPDDLFSVVAKQTGKVIYDKLAKGPPQRADRIQRKLKNSETADIYKVTLLALSTLKLGLDTINYEIIRTAIRELLADNIPNGNEVSRVLDQMSKIAMQEESSAPVLDWEKDEKRLHITDPFFAFYLKWGVNIV